MRIGVVAQPGIGATILPGRTIGARAIVGAGAVVTHDVPDGVTVVLKTALFVPLPTSASPRLYPKRDHYKEPLSSIDLQITQMVQRKAGQISC